MGAPRQNSPVASVFHFYRGQSKKGCATEVGWCIQVFKWLFKCSCLTVVAVYHIRSRPEIECDSVSYFQQKRRRNMNFANMVRTMILVSIRDLVFSVSMVFCAHVARDEPNDALARPRPGG